MAIPSVRPSIIRWSTGREIVKYVLPPSPSVTGQSMIIWLFNTRSIGWPRRRPSAVTVF